MITITMNRTFAGTYRHGEPLDIVTITPGEHGETLEQNGIRVDLQLRVWTGAPAAGIPAPEMILWNQGMTICPGGNLADAPTDLEGRTSFTGALTAGGCVVSLRLFVDGVEMRDIPVRTNSPDLDANGAVDASDVAALATLLGSRVGDANYTICGDWNEDGAIDASEVAADLPPFSVPVLMRARRPPIRG